MRILHSGIKSSGVTLMSAQSAAPVLPLVGGLVDSWGKIPEFDIEFTADGACDLTSAELMAATEDSTAISADTFTTTFAADTFTATAHGLNTGDGPVQLTTTDTLPAGLSLATDYYIIRVDANTGKFATSRANALAGTAVSLSDDGTGTHTLTGESDATRLLWASHGLLGQAEDGAISLTVTKGYTQRVRHRPRCVAYSISATLSANNLTAKAYPVAEE